MILTKEQLRQLRRIVVERGDILREIVRDTGRNLDEYAPLGASLDIATATVLHAASAEGWIAELIDALRKQYGDAELSGFLSSIAPIVPEAASDIWNAYYVDQRPFVNRVSLRRTVRRMTNEAGPRILIVRGAPRSGKSYTSVFLRHVARHIGFEIVPIDLARYYEISPVEIGRSLMLRMGLSDPPEAGSEQWSRWTHHYFDRLVGMMRSSAHTATTSWWVVFDNFQSISVPLEITDFIDEFAVRISEGELPNFHLVLLGYERVLPSVVEPLVAVEETSKLTIEDLSTFFVQFYSQHAPQLPAAERVVVAANHVSEVLQRVDPRGGNDAIGKALIEHSRKFLSEDV